MPIRSLFVSYTIETFTHHSTFYVFFKLSYLTIQALFDDFKYSWFGINILQTQDEVSFIDNNSKLSMWKELQTVLPKYENLLNAGEKSNSKSCHFPSGSNDARFYMDTQQRYSKTTNGKNENVDKRLQSRAKQSNKKYSSLKMRNDTNQPSLLHFHTSSPLCHIKFHDVRKVFLSPALYDGTHRLSIFVENFCEFSLDLLKNTDILR